LKVAAPHHAPPTNHCVTAHAPRQRVAKAHE
jgi:hypothetical protein